MRAEHPSELTSYLKSALTKNFLLSSAISLGLIVFSGYILGLFLGVSKSEEVKLAGNVFLIYSVTLPFSLIISVLVSWEYFKNRYLHPLISQIWPNLFIILFVLFGAREFGVYAIAFGYLTGSIIQFIHLLIVSGNDLRGSTTKGVGNIIKLRVVPAFLVVVFIEIVGQLNPLIDRMFFSKLQEGSISALNYANNLMLLPVSMVAMAFSTALFPKVSEYYARRDYESLRSKLGQSVELITFLFLPLAAIFLLFPVEVVKLIYIKSSFTPEDLYLVSSSFFILVLSLVFYSVYAVFSKFIYGINEAKILLGINAAAIVIKLGINIIFVDKFNYLALAASSSVSYLFLFSASFFVLIKRIGGVNRTEAGNILKILGALGITLAIGGFFGEMFIYSSPYLKIGVILFLLAVYLFVCHLMKLRILMLVFKREAGYE